MSDLEVISQLLQVGIGALTTYLFWTERKAHGETRTEYIKTLQTIHEARILDYKVWNDTLADLLLAGVKFPVYQQQDKPIPVKPQNAPKS